ncbi:MAG: AbrB/MazE/SpoVT family DNA-binding domain-containing protein [Rhizobiales bacterium]|nr:AbrB/MazE/SpoVT family DNA-binding domain-containing protein [Hyphomicrobiales bacterium]MDQ3560004.1 AbrB/MazE/SpoVT family DNA-binding domain-containing protein [Pseudomonadota bacterium]
MSDALSRVSSKFQTVIPKEVRQRLALRTGDVLRFRMTDEGAILLDKLSPIADDPFATFTEWASEEDERLYGDL